MQLWIRFQIIVDSYLSLSSMRSVPPRGSGWVLDSVLGTAEIHDAVKSLKARGTHPLPRGGTDFMSPQ